MGVLNFLTFLELQASTLLVYLNWKILIKDWMCCGGGGVKIHQFIDSNKEQEKKMTIVKRRREKKKTEWQLVKEEECKCW